MAGHFIQNGILLMFQYKNVATVLTSFIYPEERFLTVLDNLYLNIKFMEISEFLIIYVLDKKQHIVYIFFLPVLILKDLLTLY